MTPTASSGGDRKPVPQGLHPARIARIVGLGNQRSEYKGEVKERLELVLVFEIPGHPVEFTDKDTGETKTAPAHQSRKFTVSLHEKSALRPVVEAALGRKLTLEEELGKVDVLSGILSAPVQILVEHGTKQDGGTYARITKVLAAEGVEVPELHTEPLLFDPGAPDMDVFRQLPEWMRQVVNIPPEVLREAQEGGDEIDTSPVPDVPDDSGDEVPRFRG